MRRVDIFYIRVDHAQAVYGKYQRHQRDPYISIQPMAFGD
jgi:hypothetical protein